MDSRTKERIKSNKILSSDNQETTYRGWIQH